MARKAAKLLWKRSDVPVPPVSTCTDMALQGRRRRACVDGCPVESALHDSAERNNAFWAGGWCHWVACCLQFGVVSVTELPSSWCWSGTSCFHPQKVAYRVAWPAKERQTTAHLHRRIAEI
eukprot:1138201-Amphidinium_carterae.1